MLTLLATTALTLAEMTLPPIGDVLRRDCLSTSDGILDEFATKVQRNVSGIAA